MRRCAAFAGNGGSHAFPKFLYSMKSWWCLLSLFPLGAIPICAAATALPPVIDTPLQVSIATPPSVFQANGQRHLAYEIQLTNISESPWTLRHLEARDEHASPLLVADGAKIPELLWHAGDSRHPAKAPGTTLAPGESAFAYLWIDLDPKAKLPAQLQHHISVQREDEELRQLKGPVTEVRKEVREISSPLRGTDWLAVNGPSNTSQHRRGTFVLGGEVHTSQRYAIDWVRVDANLKTFHGDEKDNNNYLAFGEEVLAVADGVVSEVKDGIKENVPHQPPVVPITLETVAGNHINLDLGGGVFAMYAHLQPGSMKVKLGDHVHRGEVLAFLGNTGNSTEPHLHFQLMNRNSPLGSEGVPYALPEFTVTRRITGGFEDAKAVALPTPEKHRGEIPLEMQLVNID